jgi:hypothetical protein
MEDHELPRTRSEARAIGSLYFKSFRQCSSKPSHGSVRMVSSGKCRTCANAPRPETPEQAKARRVKERAAEIKGAELEALRAAREEAKAEASALRKQERKTAKRQEAKELKKQAAPVPEVISSAAPLAAPWGGAQAGANQPEQGPPAGS